MLEVVYVYIYMTLNTSHILLGPGRQILKQLLPVGLHVVRSPEQLDLPGSRRQSLDHAVDLVRFVTGGADLEHSVGRVVMRWQTVRIRQNL